MRKFVSTSRSIARRPQKRSIVRTQAKNMPKWLVFFSIYRRQFVGALLLILAWYTFFFHNRSPIQRVAFSQETQQEFSYQPLFDTINTGLVGQGYFKQKRRDRDGWVSTVQEQYPLVSGIKPLSFDNGTLTVSVSYNKPDFIMYSQDNSLSAVYHNIIIPYSSGSTLWSTGLQLQISLPQDQINQFSGWVFWATASQDIVRAIKRINFLSGTSVITYYPGWEKLSVQAGKDTFIIGLHANTIATTIEKWKHVLPYLPTSIPSTVDLSNPDRIIIKE